jgi:hypothetical protein
MNSLDLTRKDVRPEFHYQVGPTPELTEKPKCGGDKDCIEMVAKLADDSKPQNFSGFGKNYKLTV